jgi:parallel beta-helix repeat protein
MKKYPLIGKGLAVGIILLFVGTCIIPATAQDVEKPSLPALRGNWLYVGGSGPGNYTRIQDAIDNASDSDTVFVYSGWYNESVIINKSIFVYGEGRDTTFIGRGEDPYTAVRIVHSNVEFKRFTVLHGGHGIYINGCVGGQISENYVKDGAYGIMVLDSDSVIVSNNTIHDYLEGVYIGSSKNVIIRGNVIDGGEGVGIDVWGFKKISIKRNTIKNYLNGISLNDAFFSVVQENNFLNIDEFDARFGSSFFTVWQRNYWNQSRLLPKVIHGWLGHGLIPIPWFNNYDWHPAQEPYDIGV